MKKSKFLRLVVLTVMLVFSGISADSFRESIVHRKSDAQQKQDSPGDAVLRRLVFMVVGLYADTVLEVSNCNYAWKMITHFGIAESLSVLSGNSDNTCLPEKYYFLGALAACMANFEQRVHARGPRVYFVNGRRGGRGSRLVHHRR